MRNNSSPIPTAKLTDTNQVDSNTRESFSVCFIQQTSEFLVLKGDSWKYLCRNALKLEHFYLPKGYEYITKSSCLKLTKLNIDILHNFSTTYKSKNLILVCDELSDLYTWSRFKLFLLYLFFIYTCVWSHACPRTYVEIKGQFVGVNSLFQLWGSWGLSSGCQMEHVSWSLAADTSSCPASIFSLAPWFPIHGSVLIFQLSWPWHFEAVL